VSEQQFTPECAAISLQAQGMGGHARLIRAMADELAAVRAERDSLAAFVRSVSMSGGSPDRSRLAVQARKALDTLRVMERCPKREGGQHRWMRRDEVFGSRCFSCDARRPGT
jgi:hypothetical protein